MLLAMSRMVPMEANAGREMSKGTSPCTTAALTATQLLPMTKVTMPA